MSAGHLREAIVVADVRLVGVVGAVRVDDAVVEADRLHVVASRARGRGGRLIQEFLRGRERAGALRRRSRVARPRSPRRSRRPPRRSRRTRGSGSACGQPSSAGSAHARSLASSFFSAFVGRRAPSPPVRSLTWSVSSGKWVRSFRSEVSKGQGYPTRHRCGGVRMAIVCRPSVSSDRSPITGAEQIFGGRSDQVGRTTIGRAQPVDPTHQCRRDAERPWPSPSPEAAAISSASATIVASSGRPWWSVRPRRSTAAGRPAHPIATFTTPCRQGRPNVSVMMTPSAMPRPVAERHPQALGRRIRIERQQREGPFFDVGGVHARVRAHQAVGGLGDDQVAPAGHDPDGFLGDDRPPGHAP